ncbi:MAG: hypothetical protein AAFO95_21395, partial [Cyanobacteria bacterium J06600_6]
NKAASYALEKDFDFAIKNLEQSFRLNSELREYIKTDTNFDGIRSDKRFQDLIMNRSTDKHR